MSTIKPKIKLKNNWPSAFEPDDTRDFKEITKAFPVMLQSLIETSSIISIYDTFGKVGIGKVASRELLKSSIPELIKAKDFRGIYLFWHDNEPFYTGISRGVIKRIHQHVKGVNHFSSSLSYKMGKQHHFELLNLKHIGTRNELDFNMYSGPFKKLLKEECQVSMLPINSSIELYLFEVYVAVELKLHYYNSFKTH